MVKSKFKKVAAIVKPDNFDADILIWGTVVTGIPLIILWDFVIGFVTLSTLGVI